MRRTFVLLSTFAVAVCGNTAGAHAQESGGVSLLQPYTNPVSNSGSGSGAASSGTSSELGLGLDLGTTESGGVSLLGAGTDQMTAPGTAQGTGTQTQDTGGTFGAGGQGSFERVQTGANQQQQQFGGFQNVNNQLRPNFGNQQQQFNRMQQRGRPTFRVRLRVGFSYVGAAPSVTRSNVSARLAPLAAAVPARNGPIQVEMNGRNATLRGNVADDHDRRLAYYMARLTPGIDSVRNDLQVVSPSPSDSPSSDSSGSSATLGD